MAIDLAEIRATRARFAELGYLLGNEIVDRLEIVGLTGPVPDREMQNVVAGSRLSLGLDGQNDFVTVGGDRVEGKLHLFLLGPFSAELLQTSVAPGTQ